MSIWLARIASGVAPDDDRNDRALAVERLEARLGDRRTDVSDVPVKRCDPGRVVSEHAERGPRAESHRRWQAVREELGARALLEHVAEGVAARDETAGRAAERLAERPGQDDVLAPEQSEPLHDASARLADHADAVGVVDDQRRVVFSGERGELVHHAPGRPPC